MAEQLAVLLANDAAKPHVDDHHHLYAAQLVRVMFRRSGLQRVFVPYITTSAFNIAVALAKPGVELKQTMATSCMAPILIGALLLGPAFSVASAGAELQADTPNMLCYLVEMTGFTSVLGCVGMILLGSLLQATVSNVGAANMRIWCITNTDTLAILAVMTFTTLWLLLISMLLYGLAAASSPISICVISMSFLLFVLAYTACILSPCAYAAAHSGMLGEEPVIEAHVLAAIGDPLALQAEATRRVVERALRSDGDPGAMLNLYNVVNRREAEQALKAALAAEREESARAAKETKDAERRAREQEIEAERALRIAEAKLQAALAKTHENPAAASCTSPESAVEA